jgi:hypothetical protein
MSTEYLFVSGPLHSFAEEISRFTKTSGFHYKVYLHPPRIVHHGQNWTVAPWEAGVFVVNDKVWVSRNYIEDERGRKYKGLRAPFNNVYTAEELYNRIVEAVLKYVLASFVTVRIGERITLRIRKRPTLTPVPVSGQLRLLKGKGTKDHYFFEEIGAPGKYTVTLHPPRIFSKEDPLWGWEVKPLGGFVVNGRWRVWSCFVRDMEGHWYDGVVLGDEKLFFPAQSIYNCILESVVTYALRRFRIPFRDGEEVVVSFASTH